MTHLYPIPNNNAMYLYTNEHQILLRARTNEGMTRPSVLANDYASGLCDTFMQNTIYYAYLTQNNKLVVKNTQAHTIFYDIIFSKDTLPIHSHLQLCTFQDDLLLFYFTKGEENGNIILHFDYPLHPEKNDVYYNNPISTDIPVTNNEELEKLVSEKNELQEQFSKLLDENAHYKDMVNRATMQYNELMHVAEKYREEAIKWRNKLIVKN